MGSVAGSKPKPDGCGVCRVRPIAQVITVRTTKGRTVNVYACALCADAYHYGFR